MLSSAEAAALLAILADERSLDSHVSAFILTFKRHQHFKACCCLILLLEDRRLLKQSQRLAAFYILFELYRREQPKNNPFMSSLIDAASDEKADKVEQAFLQKLLYSVYNNEKDWFRFLLEGSRHLVLAAYFQTLMKSASEFISTFDLAAYNFRSAQTLEWWYNDKLPPESRMSSFKKASISNTILDPDVPQGYDLDSPEHVVPGGVAQLGAGNREAAAVALILTSSLNVLEPPWIRPTPPRLPPQEGEMIWQIPDIQHELLWDDGMCADTGHSAAIQDLMKCAFKGALDPAQQRKF